MGFGEWSLVIGVGGGGHSMADRGKVEGDVSKTKQEEMRARMAP